MNTIQKTLPAFEAVDLNELESVSGGKTLLGKFIKWAVTTPTGEATVTMVPLMLALLI